MQALLLAAAVSAAADSPYLPVAGPAPLRFSHPAVQKAPTFQLPPLATVDPRPAAPDGPAIPVPAHAAGASNSPAASPSVPVPDNAGGLTNPVPAFSEPLAPLPFNPVVTNAIEVVRPDTENLTPQMFMKFFSGRPGTNGPGVSIIAPMPFVPPAPPAPSSTATFQTTPPSRP